MAKDTIFHKQRLWGQFVQVRSSKGLGLESKARMRISIPLQLYTYRRSALYRRLGQRQHTFRLQCHLHGGCEPSTSARGMHTSLMWCTMVIQRCTAHSEHAQSTDVATEPVQEQKLRKRLALLQKHADVLHDETQLPCRGQKMLDKAKELLHDLQGFSRWGRFQRGMLDRASATALHQMDLPVPTHCE